MHRHRGGIHANRDGLSLICPEVRPPNAASLGRYHQPPASGYIRRRRNRCCKSFAKLPNQCSGDSRRIWTAQGYGLPLLSSPRNRPFPLPRTSRRNHARLPHAGSRHRPSPGPVPLNPRPSAASKEVVIGDHRRPSAAKFFAFLIRWHDGKLSRVCSLHAPTSGEVCRADKQCHVVRKHACNGCLSDAVLRACVVCESQQDVRIEEYTHQSYMFSRRKASAGIGGPPRFGKRSTHSRNERARS